MTPVLCTLDTIYIPKVGRPSGNLGSLAAFYLLRFPLFDLVPISVLAEISQPMKLCQQCGSSFQKPTGHENAMQLQVLRIIWEEGQLSSIVWGLSGQSKRWKGMMESTFHVKGSYEMRCVV